MAPRPLHALHLCSGYGGFELGFRAVGLATRTVAHVERDAYAAATLVQRMEDQTLDPAPIWDDLCTFDGSPWRGRVDLITAGFPCQPFSTAGSQLGVDDERWLWPDIARIIDEVGPRFVLLENVGGLIRHGLPHVLGDLAHGGFDVEWGRLSAAAVGAPHLRTRVWILGWMGDTDAESSGGDRPAERPRGRIERAEGSGQDVDPERHVADADSTRREGRAGLEPAQQRDARRSRDELGHTSGTRRPTEPGSLEGAQGATRRRQDRDHVAHSASEGLGHPDSSSGGEPVDDNAPRQPHAVRRSGRPAQWPPRRGDTDGWAEWIARGGPEPALRRGPHGAPDGLADALHLGGNGLVPLVAGTAFAVLADRIGLGKVTT